jgi:ATP-dependent Clp protease ATP-binding subunit ClpC
MGKLNKYGQDLRQALAYAREEAQRLRHRLVGPEHLLLGILRLQSPMMEGLFASLHISTSSICQALDFVVGHGNKALVSEPVLNVSARSTLARAEENASAQKQETIEIEHLFLAILDEPNSVALGVLESFGVCLDVAREQMVMLMNGGYERLHQSAHYYARYDATPILNQVSRDLTLAALDGTIDPMIGREAELERTMQILTRRTKNNPVLIGPAGVGKTAIAEGLALRIVQGNVPGNLLQHRVVTLDAGLISVGTKFRGDLEERLKRILQEIITVRGIIIVIDELHTLAQTGVAEGSVDVANLFKPMLARGEFQCIGSTTLDEYRKTIEADPALERRFQPVMVSETNEHETLQILRGLRTRYEHFHQVTVTDEALSAAVKMSSRYIQQRFQPDKALDLMDEAAARVNVRRSTIPTDVQQLRDQLVSVQREKDYAIVRRDFPLAGQRLRREREVRQALWLAESAWRLCCHQEQLSVEVQDIAQVVAMWTGIPVVEIVGEECLHLLNLEAQLHRRVIGQHEAVRVVAQAVRRSRTNLRDPRRPIGSFIFVGPTGVGKTELARALAETLFGDENALCKLDMSEFMESHHVTRLIGAPPGYIGHDQPGQLTEAVRRRPYSVILFDEVEKAHPKIFDLLLQILEDGCLTDSHGVTVDFKHCIIILTSNIGTSQLTRTAMTFTMPGHDLLATPEMMRREILPALKDVFRPEFLNRIDETIVFHSLQPEHLREIIDLLIAQIQKRLALQSVVLHVTDAARTLCVAQGYNSEYGARFLRRTVQSLLEDMLAEALLQGKIGAGTIVTVDSVEEKLYIQVQVCVESACVLDRDAAGPGHIAA